jgi:DNA mismatch repair protein MutS2
LGHIINELKVSQHQVEAQSKEIQTARQQLQEQQRLLQEEKERFSLEKSNIIGQTQKQADEYLARVKREAEEVLAEVKASLKRKEAPPKWHELEKARRKVRKLNVILPQEQEPVPAVVDLIPGNYVQIRSIGKKGHILEGPNAQGEVQVQVGVWKLSVSQEDLMPTRSPEPETWRKANNAFLEKARNISPEIDLRGLTADDALHEVEKYLEDAYLAGIESVRIIHGKGTGALRKAIRDLLSQYPRVKSFRDGGREEGGTGVTVAYL